MKRYTQEEFNNMPVNKYGKKECPNGDYSAVNVNGEWCKYMTFIFATVICLYGLIAYQVIIYRNKHKYVISAGCRNYDSLKEAAEDAKKECCYCDKTYRMLEILLEEEPNETQRPKEA